MDYYHRTYGQILSDTFSSNVLHSILSSPTDTLQALNEAIDDAKIQNITQSTKNKLRKFYNGDFKINYNAPFQNIRRDLRKLFTMGMEGATDYAIYDIPNGRMAFRLADHNANGNNFEQDEADVNISVYVEIRKFDVPESSIPFTEWKISEEIFNNNREGVVRAIVDGVANALNGEEFSLPDEFAERRDYPIMPSEPTQDTNNQDNLINCNRNMRKNKQVVRLTESQLHNIISESVKRVLRENEFEKKYDAARMQAAQRGKIWGMEMKNPQNEWEYGNIEFNPNTMEMSCMGATIQVEEDWDVYDALEQLSYELYELGYGNEG